MTRESRENERLKIRQEHLFKALNHTEHFLNDLLRELRELIELYKEKKWTENKNYIKWKSDIEMELAIIKRQKILFRKDIEETVNATPLDQFND